MLADLRLTDFAPRRMTMPDPGRSATSGMDSVRCHQGSIERSHVYVLHFGGPALLRECLPTVIAAARATGVPCPVTVVYNGATEAEAQAVRAEFPGVGVRACDNRGLASFNGVLAGADEPVSVLLNNDVKLAPDALDLLLGGFEDRPEVLFTAPQCWTFDGQQYEGMRTRVRSRFGLVQGLARVPGHERTVDQAGLTASAGPVLAVRREAFLALGGYDAQFFPGRIEDLDLGFRAWMAGLTGWYVPESRAWHQGAGSFGPAFGAGGCDRLAARNTLLFTWSNLAGRRLLAHLAWLPARVGVALARGRLGFVGALVEAIRSLPGALERRRSRGVGSRAWIERQEAYFDAFPF
jgi:GT2 family glycosyltransferase